MAATGRRPRRFGVGQPPITVQIAKTLKRYPDGGQILKELIQNADDAGAVEVKFMLDRHDHPCTKDELLEPELIGFQGPALYAWNNAVFADDDWSHIGNMYQSSKEKEPLKVGRFGLGFMSVFHITDLPIIVSDDTVGILDPHEKYTKTGKHGLLVTFSEFMNCPGHAVCFNGIFGLDTTTNNYQGTLFRFPLRKRNANSEIITDTAYPPERVLETLYDSFFKEAPLILLFLKHVQEISLYEGSKLLYKVAIDPLQKQVVAAEKRACVSHPAESVLRAYSTTVQVHRGDTSQNYHWLIMNLIDCQTKRSQQLGFLPWVGIAAPLPGTIALRNLEIRGDSVAFVVAKAPQILQKLSSCITMPWTGEVVGHNQGHVFCFLPLPGKTSLPVNVHGYFSISDNRRSIRWPSSDDSSEDALWNKFLVQTLIAPAYSILLIIRSSLLSYSGTPLPLPSTEGGITDPYAAWPLYSEVKNNEIWVELLEPTLKQVYSERILWSATGNGKWVTPKEALFLPQSIPEVAIKILIEASQPVVSLPHEVRDTLNRIPEYSQLLSQNVVTPARIRKTLHSSYLHSLVNEIAKHRDKTLQLLIYILSDVDKQTSDELKGIKLLPLATGECTSFSNSPNTESVYVLQSSESTDHILKCLPGMERHFVDPTLPSTLLERLSFLAKNGCLQLKLWETQKILKYLLLSLTTWSSCNSNVITWNPGVGHHPPVSWLTHLWKYLRNFSDLNNFEGLCIVPVEILSEKRISLVPLPKKLQNSSSNGYFFCSGDRTMNTILTKLDATVIHNNQAISNHQNIRCYISVINILTVLSFLNHCPQKVSKCLNDDEKSHLRREIARNYSDSAQNRQTVSRLPIFVAGVGATKACMVALLGSDQEPILPSTNIQFHQSLCYPPNILSTKESIVVYLFRCLCLPEIPGDELCCKCLIPFALVQCKESGKWCNGDNLFVWILKRYSYSSKVIKCLSNTPFVRTNTDPSVLVKPCQLYKTEQQFQMLFSMERDQVFACPIYEEKCVTGKLELCGLQTWKKVKSSRQELEALMKERAKSVYSEKSISYESALQRSRYILEITTKHRIVESVKKVPFLFSQPTCPDYFPTGLTWFGTDKLYTCGDICFPNGLETACLVGSVKPILRNNYSILPEPRVFYQPSAVDVILQLNRLVAIPQVCDNVKVTDMVGKIYNFLSSHSTSVSPNDLPKNWIWWRNEKGIYSFRPASEFVIQTPIPLSPFVFDIRSSDFLNKYEQLFRNMRIQDNVSDTTMVNILEKLGQISPLSCSQIEQVEMILNLLHKHKFDGDVLMLTVNKTLKPARICVFDDREWVTRKAAAAKSHRFTFVHDSIPAKIAQHFGVEPLSLKVAPSKKLSIKYKPAGPHETITRRIHGIVEDYSGNIDIFKELIQNADDAKATQVKFVIDWREHSKDQLISEELGCWQGPALLAYNNAVFSESDFDNICKLAAESKLNDPLKTGRFGLGFCSTYYLTDVPSFVSQRYFTMFDPHTWYLKDRVSHNQPGIKIDLVKSQEDLPIYEHQFVPFDGLFGCNIFTLEDQGFQGTIFRFPFRTKYCEASEICRKCNFDKTEIDDHVKHFKRDASNILLFLKNIEQVEVFVLDKTASHPSDMRLLFSATKTCDGNSASRLSMIQNHSSRPPPNCSSCVIEFNHHSAKEQTHSRRHYIVASALSPVSTTRNQEGLIPLAEIAVEVVKKDDLLIPKPIENALLFCFLPLPLQSYLPFHVNGFFDLGKDRRNLTEALDSVGSKWNSSLVEGAIPFALESLMAFLTSKCNLCKVKNEKEQYLMQYYSLWPRRRDDNRRWLADATVKSSIDRLTKSNRNILWCDINEGKWVSPCEAYLFDSRYAPALDPRLPSDITNEVITLLLHSGYSVLPISTPWAIQNQLKKQLSQNKHVFTYERFFKEIFLPNIQSIAADVRNNQLLFVLKTYQRESQDYHWVKDVLTTTKCIPTQCTEKLVEPTQLIDPRRPHIASLYSPEEGRFPIENFTKRISVMMVLGEFGMVSNTLPIPGLVERAELFATRGNCNEISDQMKALFNYLLHIEHLSSSAYMYYLASEKEREDKEKRIKALWEVKFLKARSCPSEVTLPWCPVKTYFSPSQVYSPDHSQLVFTHKPVVDLPDKQDSLVYCLGISNNIPDISCVLKQITELIEFILSNHNTIDKETTSYLDEVFQSIYEFFDRQMSNEKVVTDTIREKLTDLKWIWQDGRLLASCQALRSWKYPSVYLCELSQSNKSHERLFELLGVENEATVECLLGVLKQVKLDYGEMCLSNADKEFVVGVIKEFYKCSSSLEGEDVFLLDEEGVLRPASQMTCDSAMQGEWMQKLTVFKEFIEKGGHFLNCDIPRQHGLELGARPILDAILKEIEDDSFLDGTDFGQEEDLVDRLNSILKKYSDDAAIFREFIQNADDAKASELVFVLDNRDDFPDHALLKDNTEWKELQKVPALCIFNNRPFSEKDLQGICQLGRGGKSFSAETIGRFGIGFNVAYHLTDCPMFVTYNSAGIPTDFCVFDPLRYYLPALSMKRKPGRRWKITDEHIKQFPNQFQPFLFDKFHELQSLAPSCMKDLSNGFVVFRLPLVRKRGNDKEKILCKGDHKSSYKVEENLKDLQSTAKENLLFLNHLRNISCFKITNDGLCLHMFSSAVKTVHSSNIGSYQIIATCAETREWYPGDYCSDSKSNWLLCKKNGFRANDSLLEKAASEGLKPIGGVATLLDSSLLQTGRLFCYLPMLCPSGLPVHLNGHFLVDDSRKHLTEIKGLEEWNSTIATEILVPSYVELILSAKEYVTGTKESIEWFYRLFPDLTKDNTHDSLKVGEKVYECLLKSNCAVLLDQRSVKRRLTLNWLCPTGNDFGIGYFYKLSMSVSAGITKDLQNVLLSLGMPITRAPDYIFESLCKISSQYHATGLLTPAKTLNYLKQISLADGSNETIIKDNCEMLLKFCLYRIADYELNKDTLVGVPLLLSAEDTLETTGSLFSHRFVDLLPHCQRSFINPRLELENDACRLSTRLVSSGIICRLSDDFVAKNIQLESVSDPTRLPSSQLETVQMLWQYFRFSSALSPSSFLSSVITEHFCHFPILPTLAGIHYPPNLGKCIFMKNVHVKEGMVLSVMKKLGYAELDQGATYSAEISDIVSCSTHCEDIIKCFSLRKPLSYSASLTSAEVNSFILVLSQSDGISNPAVLECLKNLSLYETVDGSYTSLIGKKVHIVSSDIPTAGLLELSCGTDQVVLKYPGSCVEGFYRNVLDDFEKARCNACNFYSNFLLPNFERLSDHILFEHLKYLRGHIQNEDWQDVLSALKQTPLITTLKHGRVLVSDLYDPQDSFFSMFYKSKLPPCQWCTDDWLPFLRHLGLRTKATTEEWLKMAKEFAAEAKQGYLNVVLCQAKCSNLLETLKRMVNKFTENNQHDFKFMEFLDNLSSINFIYCPDPPPLELLIESVTGRRPTKSKYRIFTRFHEAVSYKCQHLAGLSREILPQSCQFVMRDKRVIQALSVREPLAVKAVVQNLLLLSDFLCVANTAILTSNERIPSKINELKRLFEDHYDFLENGDLHEKCLDELLTKRCMVLFPDENSFVLVQPSQLVQHISPQYDFHPFCYGVPPDLRRFGKLLSRLKVQEDLTPIHYLQILSNVKSEVEKSGTKLKDDEQYVRVCIHAFNALVVSLRQQNTFVSEIRKIKCYLPSKKYELLESKQLVYDDTPWIGSRLQKAITSRSYQYNFVVTPPPDDSGQSTPPGCLGIKSLSSLAVEKLHSDTESRVNRCTDDELDRCQLVKLLQETLQSRDFTRGLGRLYWDEHRKNPKLNKEYRTVVEALHKCKIKCVHMITTVICVQNVEVSGTEDTKKLCHFVTKDDETLLYISHTHPIDLLEHLSANIIKFLKHLLRNESHIKAILDCHPSDIPKALDLREVATFDPRTVDAAINDGCQIGSTFEECLSNRHFLLICNYTPGEFVVYQSSSGVEFRYARVVESKYKPGCDITDRYLELHTDMHNDCPVSAYASPLQVYKILDTSQMALLWNKNFDPSFVTPVTLANIPGEIKRWLKEILCNTPHLKNSLDLCRLSQRLVVHMHYMFVTHKSCPKLFDEGVQKLLTILRQVTWSSDTDNDACVCEVKKLVDQLTGSFLRPRSMPSMSASQSVSPPLVYPVSQPSRNSGSSFSISQSNQSRSNPSAAPTLSQTFGMSRFSQLAQNAAQSSRFVSSPQQNVITAQLQPTIDLNKAKMWLHQAKADLLAAHYLCNGESHLPDQSVSHEEDESDDEARGLEQEEDTAALTEVEEDDHDNGEKEVEEDDHDNGEKEVEEDDHDNGEKEVEEDDHDNGEKEVEEDDHDNEENVEGSSENHSCRFPALVCFLTHDVVEKCLKGVIYAKSGLSSRLVNSNVIVELMQVVEASNNFTPQYIQVVKECTMQINEHIAKSRYPNYQVPPCAPAEVYTVLQATEALAAAIRLMKKTRSLPDVCELIGNLEVPEASLGFIAGNQEVPPFWDEHTSNEEFKLVLLKPEEDEFQGISALFLQSMPSCEIRRIDRIQNRLLWRKYCDRAKQMMAYDQVLGEKPLFHGTRTNKPEKIYKGDASFDMRYCQSGLWGRGNYFAVNASYSNGYAHIEAGGVHQMLVANVLTGHSYHCHSNSSLKQPPFREHQGTQDDSTVTRRYDTVNGVTGGSKVYITYDNDKAYPAYLISYLLKH